MIEVIVRNKNTGGGCGGGKLLVQDVAEVWFVFLCHICTFVQHVNSQFLCLYIS